MDPVQRLLYRTAAAVPPTIGDALKRLADALSQFSPEEAARHFAGAADMVAAQIERIQDGDETMRAQWSLYGITAVGAMEAWAALTQAAKMKDDEAAAQKGLCDAL